MLHRGTSTEGAAYTVAQLTFIGLGPPHPPGFGERAPAEPQCGRCNPTTGGPSDIRREGASEAAPEVVRQAVGGGY